MAPKSRKRATRKSTTAASSVPVPPALPAPPAPARQAFNHRGDPSFPSEEMRNVYDKLWNLKFCRPTLIPHIKSLSDVGVLDPVREMFSASGLDIIFSRQAATHPAPLFEFVASFSPVWDGVGYSHWNFQLNGTPFSLDRAEVCRLLGFPLDGQDARYSDAEHNEFWQFISGFDAPYLATHPAACIQRKEWKVIHRLVSMAINVRKEGGTICNEKDIDVMISMSRGLPIDWFAILTARFLDWQQLTGVNVNGAISGGLFVTILGEELGFDFGSPASAREWRLDTKKMIDCHMLKKDLTWDHRPTPPDTGIKGKRLEKKRRRLEQGPSNAPAAEPDFDAPEAQEPPVPAHGVPPLSVEERFARFEAQQSQIIAAQARMAEEFADFRYHHERALQWQHESWTEFFRHQQFFRFTDPPPTRFSYTSPEPPPPIRGRSPTSSTP